jgi:hypothetical protein
MAAHDRAARLRGHFNFFGVRFNEARLAHFQLVCISAFFKWLNRRSQKRSLRWKKLSENSTSTRCRFRRMVMSWLTSPRNTAPCETTNRRARCGKTARPVL